MRWLSIMREINELEKDKRTPPFLKEIIQDLPKDFRLPQLDEFNGTTDPQDHLHNHFVAVATRRRSHQFKFMKRTERRYIKRFNDKNVAVTNLNVDITTCPYKRNKIWEIWVKIALPPQKQKKNKKNQNKTKPHTKKKDINALIDQAGKAIITEEDLIAARSTKITSNDKRKGREKEKRRITSKQEKTTQEMTEVTFALRTRGLISTPCWMPVTGEVLMQIRDDNFLTRTPKMKCKPKKQKKGSIVSARSWWCNHWLLKDDIEVLVKRPYKKLC